MPLSAYRPSAYSATTPNQVHFHLTTGYDFWFSDYVAGKTFKGHPATHEKFILLAQSYMPAQCIHVSQPNWGVSP